jgi:hypothetical protein
MSDGWHQRNSTILIITENKSDHTEIDINVPSGHFNCYPPTIEMSFIWLHSYFLYAILPIVTITSYNNPSLPPLPQSYHRYPSISIPILLLQIALRSMPCHITHLQYSLINIPPFAACSFHSYLTYNLRSS